MAELFDRITPHQRFQLTFEVNSDICWVLAAFENLGIKVNKTNCELLDRFKHSGRNKSQITFHVAYPFESKTFVEEQRKSWGYGFRVNF